jgi:hypothetical protein
LKRTARASICSVVERSVYVNIKML